MRIVRYGERYFVAEHPRAVGTVALRLLNERRVENNITNNLEKAFIETVCDEQDIDSAIAYMSKYGMEIIHAETV